MLAFLLEKIKLTKNRKRIPIICNKNIIAKVTRFTIEQNRITPKRAIYNKTEPTITTENDKW